VNPGFPVIASPSDAAAGGYAGDARAACRCGRDGDRDRGGRPRDDANRLAAAKVEATLLEPVVMIDRFYRLAEALALRLGRDPDRPRNLRKVTETV